MVACILSTRSLAAAMMLLLLQLSALVRCELPTSATELGIAAEAPAAVAAARPCADGFAEEIEDDEVGTAIEVTLVVLGLSSALALRSLRRHFSELRAKFGSKFFGKRLAMSHSLPSIAANAAASSSSRARVAEAQIGASDARPRLA
eukprot:TRINITY_DN27172_c0_g1_i1.p1 TRINITY_DN27172_c0_g1~~TRINITY_DN27172_c0_g1_i1.p1  ORF type:complete len:147 (+),score=27.63 TRINITY_DN27172_c0_g1_i1:122-562(+)